MNVRDTHPATALSMSRVYESWNNLGQKGLLEVILSKQPLKAEQNSKLAPNLKLDEAAWAPVQSIVDYVQGWTFPNLTGALVQCLTIFMEKNHLFYYYFPCCSLCLLALILSSQTCQKRSSTPAVHPPTRQQKTAIRPPIKPSHTKAEQTQTPLLPPGTLVLQSPLCSSVPMHFIPIHQSMMLHSFPPIFQFVALCSQASTSYLP